MHNNLRWLRSCLLIGFVCPAFGAGVITHIADGGSWYTTFTAVNPTSSKARVTVSLRSDTGQPLALAIRGLDRPASNFYWDLEPHSMGYAQTLAATQDTVTGWATVDSSITVFGGAGPSVSAIFTQRLAGRREEYEASVPAVNSTYRPLTIPVYTWGGLETGIALVNSSKKDITVFVTGRDADGQVVVLSGLSMKAGAHTAFSVSERFPDMKNRLGSLEFTPQGLSNIEPGLSVIGLRFSPSGPFATILPLE